MDMKVFITVFQKMIWFIGVSQRFWDICNKNIKNDADSAEI